VSGTAPEPIQVAARCRGSMVSAQVDTPDHRSPRLGRPVTLRDVRRAVSAPVGGTGTHPRQRGCRYSPDAAEPPAMQGATAGGRPRGNRRPSAKPGTRSLNAPGEPLPMASGSAHAAYPAVSSVPVTSRRRASTSTWNRGHPRPARRRPNLPSHAHVGTSLAGVDMARFDYAEQARGRPSVFTATSAPRSWPTDIQSPG
jgi:hypothetical protein